VVYPVYVEIPEGLKLRMLALPMSDGFRCLPVAARALL